MPLDNPRSGINWASEYMVSGVPWVTSSTLTNGQEIGYDLDHVSKEVTIINLGPGQLNVGFTHLGLTQESNYFMIPSGSSERFDIRIKSIFLTCIGNVSFSILAALTGIMSEQMPVLTGSAGVSGVG